MNTLAAYTHALLYISRRQVLAQAHHEFAVMLEGDDILSLRRTRVQDLGKATNLKWWRLLCHLAITCDVPLVRQGQASVTFFDALHLDNFLVKCLNLVLNFLESLSVRSLAVALEELNISIRQRVTLVVLLFFIIFLCGRIVLLSSRVDLLRFLLGLRHSAFF